MESFISLTKPLSDPSSLEVGLVGDEGMNCIALILGVGISPLHAVVQGEGSALRIHTFYAADKASYATIMDPGSVDIS